jgi:hypothetical protein
VTISALTFSASLPALAVQTANISLYCSYVMCCGKSTILTAALWNILLSSPFAHLTNAENRAWCARAVQALRETLRVPSQEQAMRAAANADLRYLEWFGFASEIPGIKSRQCVGEAHLSKPFEGTTDALCSNEHLRLWNQSASYAKEFNRYIAIEREKRGLKSCNEP